MDLYTLTENFLTKDIVDEFVSAIWTERYSTAGDVQIVAPADPETISKLAEGTLLALRGSKEVMILGTQVIEKGLLTVVGSTLETFLNERYAWFRNPDSSLADERVVDYTDDTRKPGEFIPNVVDQMVINPVDFTSSWAPANLDWPLEVIPNLELGDIDTSGDIKRISIPIGPLWDVLEPVAVKEGVGVSLYLESAHPIDGYVLKFTTYQGKDRTSDQVIYPLVRLVPELDSLSDLKEVRSIANYKNVAYVYYQGIITKHLAEPSLPEPEGFARRVLLTDAAGEPVGRKVTGTGNNYGGSPSSTFIYTVVDAPEIAAFREQNAKDALANHNYIKAIDGQTSPENDYKYGVDYGLGDIIELEGLTGLISKARVTEYIRSQDKFGEKEYPTISVVD